MFLFDNIIFRSLSRICDFILLNLLWIICSLPIITIGASTSALYYVMLKLVKNEDGYIARGFFKGFKENFKQSTVVWFLILVFGIMIAIDYRFISYMNTPLRPFLKLILLFLTFVLICANLYVFPLIARYQNSTPEIIKNALLLSLMKLPYTLLMLIIMGVLFFLTVASLTTSPISIFFWNFIGISFLFWINSHIFRKVFSVLENTF